MIKPVSVGTVAYVKTTKEPVFVLEYVGDPKVGANEAYSVVTVRRPTQTKYGVEHLSETFTAGELQTFEEKIADELKEQSYFLEQRRAFEKAFDKEGTIN